MDANRTSHLFVECSLNHSDCKPIKIWLLIRHGTRLPTRNGLKRFSEMEKVMNHKISLLNQTIKKSVDIFSFVMKSLKILPK